MKSVFAPDSANLLCWCMWKLKSLLLILIQYFCRMSRGVRNLPGSFQSATSSVPSGKSLMYFGLLLASGVFFIIIAFTIFLPVTVIAPQKFAICFTMGCAFIIGSFFALKGPKNQLAHMTSMEVILINLIIFIIWNCFLHIVCYQICGGYVWAVKVFSLGQYFIFSDRIHLALFFPETSFHIGISSRHSRDNICFHGAS